MLLDDPANAVLTVEQAPFPAQIFVRGLNQDWGETNPMSYVGGTAYRAVIPLAGVTADDLSFKVASSDWSTVDCGDSVGAGVDVGVATPIDCTGGQGNINLNTTETGTYDFMLDAADTVNPALSVTGP